MTVYISFKETRNFLWSFK